MNVSASKKRKRNQRLKATL